jgi:FMN-dependent oxidoreductase (nitrilotriacetate monooxygenase family)
VVTSTLDSAAKNYGRDHIPEHDARYARAAEYLTVVNQLWNAWLPGAVVGDREAGKLVDPNRVRAINYRSERFRVRGPLNTPTSPQVTPIIAQAGGSPAGRGFAAAHADIVYAQHVGHDDARRYRDDLRTRAVAAGRGADAVKLLPGLVPYVRGTRAEAESFRQELAELHDPTEALRALGTRIGIEVSDVDSAARVPDRVLEAVAASPVGPGLELPQTPTWRELGYLLSSRYSHKVIVGTPEEVADYITDGYTSGAFDGVSVVPPIIPLGLEEFVDRVVPILQHRGIHKTEYRTGTLRDRLGLAAPSVDTAHWQGHYA